MERQEGLCLPKGEALVLASCFQAQWQSAVLQVYSWREDFRSGLLLQAEKIWESSGKPLEAKPGILFG